MACHETRWCHWELRAVSSRFPPTGAKSKPPTHSLGRGRRPLLRAFANPTQQFCSWHGRNSENCLVSLSASHTHSHSGKMAASSRGRWNDNHNLSQRSQTFKGQTLWCHKFTEVKVATLAKNLALCVLVRNASCFCTVKRQKGILVCL